MHCDLPGGQTTSPCGQGAAPVSPSVAQVNAEASTTSGTSGPHGSVSSESAALQSSLESRLRALTASSGSMLFALTWKQRAMPSGRQICALRASVRRTSGSGCSSWPTPTTSDASGSAYQYSSGDKSKIALKLVGAARLANWPTPRKTDGNKGPGLKKTGQDLVTAASLSIAGGHASGLLAAMEKRGRLNPALSRWLMGLPQEWDDCAPTATQSFLKSRRRSSGQ
jgi:hypothetical protein